MKNFNQDPFQMQTQDPTMIAFGMFVLLIGVFIGLIVIAELF